MSLLDGKKSSREGELELLRGKTLKERLVLGVGIMRIWGYRMIYFTVLNGII